MRNVNSLLKKASYFLKLAEIPTHFFTEAQELVRQQISDISDFLTNLPRNAPAYTGATQPADNIDDLEAQQKNISDYLKSLVDYSRSGATDFTSTVRFASETEKKGSQVMDKIREFRDNFIPPPGMGNDDVSHKYDKMSPEELLARPDSPIKPQKGNVGYVQGLANKYIDFNDQKLVSKFKDKLLGGGEYIKLDGFLGKETRSAIDGLKAKLNMQGRGDKELFAKLRELDEKDFRDSTSYLDAVLPKL